ncbi:hypothetical protein NHN26_16225 [Rhodovulum tesquicola]|uniref:hypothetical protein n=1 Tax=Rhodovulum tesquicola TaxID=540254 RepID=UPI002097FFF7|nr:hypothetical protein [Rhodovulum tesquicola]MCO8146758.1 hypothetical protein [Rhodovulum tesquicola]
MLMDATGRVERLTLFDFGALSAGRPRVRRFVVPDLACADPGRVPINGTDLCKAGEPGLAPCAEGLHGPRAPRRGRSSCNSNPGPCG